MNLYSISCRVKVIANFILLGLTVMTEPEFAENFRGLTYLPDAHLVKDGKFIRVHLKPIPLRQISILMAFVACILIPLFLIFIGADGMMIGGFTAAGIFCGCGFLGILWMLSRSQSEAALPSIDVESDALLLPSGTSIAACDIHRFRQRECTTKTTNFRLVLTSVETVSCKRQFAVCVEIGRFGSTKIGKQIAEELGKELHMHESPISSTEQLKELALS